MNCVPQAKRESIFQFCCTTLCYLRALISCDDLHKSRKYESKWNERIPERDMNTNLQFVVATDKRAVFSHRILPR